jgi:hypothetical protein
MAAHGTTQVTGRAPANSAPTKDTEPHALNFRDAYDKTLQAALALDTGALLPVNIDLPSAVNTAVAAVPQILALRDSVQKELPNFDVSNFDRLEQFALAAGHAHAQFLSASAPPEALADLNARGMELRDTLYTDARALAGRGLINGDRLGDFKANVGYKNLTYDLLGLANLLRASWDKIASKSAIELSELDEAEALAGQLTSALAAREQGPVLAADVAVQRQRNFTLFAQAYDQVRRAISYLRWTEDDLERVAPSLYGGRVVNRKKEPQPSPSPAPEPNPAPAPTAAAESGAPVAAGMPGGSPFMSAS